MSMPRCFRLGSTFPLRPLWNLYRWPAGPLLLFFFTTACTSIGPATVPRDRVDYVNAIGNSWERETLLNIVKLRYGHAPVFLSITQVVTGYQFQGTASAGLIASTFNPVTNAFGFSGAATAQGQYTDRPTIIYTPLTGADFLQKLMTPIPPSAMLFVLQAGYPADLIMPLALDSINGISNESRREMGHAADPRFIRLVQLIRDLELAEALQVRIERPKNGSETSLITFPNGKDAQAKAESAEVRDLLGLRPGLQTFAVYYGGYSGKDDEISMMTRSMLQVMLELAAVVQVSESEDTERKVTPGLVEESGHSTQAPALLNIMSGINLPPDPSIAVQYDGRWFWIADTDIRSKSVFAAVMLLFSISDIGIKGMGPIVTIPANGGG
jgi:hypothetical protein